MPDLVEISVDPQSFFWEAHEALIDRNDPLTLLIRQEEELESFQ